MIIKLQKRKTQSILEYALLVMVIAAALMAMQKYVRRALNARLKQVQEELDESSR
jgi:Flp pilus assembly pilin Flp